jgi:hypothetical protein
VHEPDPYPPTEPSGDREPSDGERTVSRIEWDAVLRLESVLSVARELSESPAISLGESALCVFCRRDARDHVPVLEIELAGEALRRLPSGKLEAAAAAPGR